MTEEAPRQVAGTRIDVFVSHASADAATAHSIVDALEHAGLNCWIAPRDIVPGSLYAEGIVSAINGARVFLLLLSERAVASSHVGKEIERASAKGRPIITVRADTAPLSPAFEYFLSESQWIDLEANNAARGKLVDAIRRHVGSPTPDVRTARDSGVEAPNNSIAVLAFTDLSEKKDQEYLSDGMAEEIINLLAKAPDLLVSARTSSFYFKGRQTKLSEIARELGVAHILEGSIRRSANRLRVTTQLIRADTGYHVWSETYERELRDVFELQDDIAHAVVQALQIKLMGGELRRSKGGTQNLDAYQLYLRAVSAVYQYTRSSLDAAGEYLDQATKIDPDYGMAWAWLAFVAVVRTESGYIDAMEGYERARNLAQYALQLSSDLADAHACLQYLYRSFDWNWPMAEAEGRRVFRIDPTNQQALMFAGKLSSTLGNWDDAERYLRAALARDPLNPNVYSNLGINYYGAGRFVEAEAMHRRVSELAPDFYWTRPYLAKTLLALAKPDAALAVLMETDQEDVRLLFLPIVLQAVGRTSEVHDALRRQIVQWCATGAYYVALTYAYLGDCDLALQWLERAYTQKDFSLVEIVGEPLLENLADDARYEAFLRKLKLRE